MTTEQTMRLVNVLDTMNKSVRANGLLIDAWQGLAVFDLRAKETNRVIAHLSFDHETREYTLDEVPA